MTTAPLVMPEVITGLSLLLLFVALEQLIGWPAGAGHHHHPRAHDFLHGLCHGGGAVAAGGVRYVPRRGGDGSRCPAAKVFFRITLPIIFPAIVSGWLLAFTLSWDDLVISQFTSGPGSSTLPMVVFSKVRLGVSPEINVLATIMVLLVATGIAISTVWMRYREKRRVRDLQLAAAANL